VPRTLLIPLVVAAGSLVLLVGGPPLTFAVAYAAAAGLLAVAWRAPGARRAALAAIGVLLLVASLRPPWGVAGKHERRYTFSLTSVAQLSDSTPPGPTQQCNWLTGSGREALCAPDPGRQPRFFLLATAPALLALAILLGAAGTTPRPYPGVFHVLIMATCFAAIGVLMVLINEGAGLAAFRNATIRFGGPGLLHAVLGVLGLVGAGLEARRANERLTADR
jgi:hypothetical protein